MEDMNQAQAAAMGAADTNRQQPGGQYAQPQPGGLYQYVPGAGFVQVQGAPQMATGMGMQAPTMQPGMGAPNTGMPDMETQASAGAADASATSGLFGQGTPEDKEPKFDQNKIGQMYGVVNDFMNGDTDPAKIMNLFQNTDGDFWKGAIVGAAAGFLASNENVRNAVAGVFGSMFGNSDPEGPQVTVKDKTEE